MVPEDELATFDLFRDCLSTSIIQKLTPTPLKIGKKRAAKGRRDECKRTSKSEIGETDAHSSDATELEDFVEYLAEEIFLGLPSDLRTLSYASVRDSEALAEKYAIPLGSVLLGGILKPLPLTISDSLCSYGLVDEPSDLDRFLDPILSAFIVAVSAPPPEFTPALVSSRATECEICARSQLPLTYHHLIPRAMHAKAVKRGWHKEWELSKVAWLCRACHSFVHKIASNEELARELYDVDLLMERDDVQRWASWVGKIRWKGR